MFITIEHGDDKRVMVNPDCSAFVFLEYIRKACGLEKDVRIDLCDENAVPFEMYKKDPLDNCFDYFMPRSTFMLVQIERNPDGSYGKIVPFLQDYEKKYPMLERKIRHRDKKVKQVTIPENKQLENTSKVYLKGSEKSTTKVAEPRNGSVGLKEKKSFKGNSKKK